MTEPLWLLRRTYDLCRDFAIIDTGCHREPISGYLHAPHVPLAIK